MEAEEHLVAVGELVGDRRRLRMLLALVDGQAWPAGELARCAGIQPSTASYHLDQLVKGGLLKVIPQGRHRYYRVAGPQVIAWLEQLAALAPPGPARSLRGTQEREALRFARTCYDHLAGRLGVAWTIAWVARGFIHPADDGFILSPAGVGWLSRFEVPVTVRPGSIIPKHAVDWTERVPHFAGPIAKAMTARLLEVGWIMPGPTRRAIRITSLGARQFQAFGVVLPEDPI